jgi:hypothetical protein
MTENRIFTDLASKTAKDLLNELVNPATSVDAYRAAMVALGEELGRKLPADVAEPVLVVSTAEDADYLAEGYRRALDDRRIAHKSAVFWNHHYSLGNGKSVAPYIKRYKQPGYTTCRTVVMLKSVISGSCVIRTNLQALLNELDVDRMKRIFVAAPVKYKDADASLRKEFPLDIVEKFDYQTFALDADRAPDGTVLPGIGGSVYQRLGFEDQPAKLKTPFTPDFVKRLQEQAVKPRPPSLGFRM